ncbi:MAG: FMN-binding protein [Clostridia bacterium]
MSDIGKLSIRLLALAAFAGLALGATNAITAAPIKAQELQNAATARQTVLPEATTFDALTATDGLTEAYIGRAADGTLAGKTGTILTQGFGGEIEVTVGMNMDNVITGVTVGGVNFKETAGLGAKAKDVAFTGQFTGKIAPIALKKDGGAIDAITSATISSNAVTQAVNHVVGVLTSLKAPEKEVG